MRNSELTYDQAMDILHHIVDMRLRWGKQYEAGDLGIDTVCDALIVLAQTENEEVASLKEQLTKANRQLAAANARAKKQEKREGDEST